MISEIIINGSKNAALPIIAATLLDRRMYRIKNVPMIEDVFTCLNVLKQFNVSIKFDMNELCINTANMQIPNKLEYKSNTRGTYYFICTTLHYDVAHLEFILGNGCKISNANRKINYHLDLISLSGKKHIHDVQNDSLRTCGDFSQRDVHYSFKKPSVGATINALFIFSKLPIKSVFENYAKDPYIYAVIHFLSLLGHNIICTDAQLIINGIGQTNTNCSVLKNDIHYNIIGDPIEALSYIIYTAINLENNTISPVAIKQVNATHLGHALQVLNDIGIELIETNEDQCYYIKKNTLKPFAITTGYFPDIYTDIQPFFCLLSLFIDGVCEITETVWNNRFNYVNEINKIGCNIDFLETSTIRINSASIDIVSNPKINHVELNCTDLRGGMVIYMLLRFIKIKNDDFNFNLNDKCIIDRGYCEYENNINVILHQCSLKINTNYPTASLSNINIGGMTEYYSVFECINDLVALINFCKHLNLRFKLIGGGYNVYFNDHFDGLIIKNSYKYIFHSHVGDSTMINVSSGTELMDLVHYCAIYGIDISALAGIPGTVGGAIYGNAGAYGVELSNFIENCHVLTVDNAMVCLKRSDMQFEYRNSILKNNKLTSVIVSVDFIFENKNRKSSADIVTNIHNIIKLRNDKFTYKNTLGSIFKNIRMHGTTNMVFAWQLIDLLGLRGQTINSLLITDKHPNIFINVDSCSPAGMTNLVNQIIHDTKQKTNLQIELEIECV
jgi:UDP-N-acetylglucosamine 1-carboxyvinyltransferase